MLEQAPENNNDRPNNSQVNDGGLGQPDETPRVFALSAGSRSSLGAYAASLAEYLASDEARNVPGLMRDISFTLAQRRTHFAQSRRAVVARSRDELRERLLGIAADVSAKRGGPSLKGDMAVPGLVFTGQGAQ